MKNILQTGETRGMAGEEKELSLEAVQAMMDRRQGRFFSFELASDFDSLLVAREKFSRLVEGQTSRTNTLLIGFHEILANAIEHGNCLQRDCKVQVKVLLSEEILAIAIEDGGKGFDWHQAINRELDCQGERGRGILITRLCYDYVFFNEKGNKVWLVKKL